MANPDATITSVRDDDRREQSSSNQYRRAIYDIPVTVTVSIGQARMSVSEILELRSDSIIPLTSRIDDPLDLTINNKVIARGELIETADGVLALKITEIAETAENDLG